MKLFNYSKTKPYYSLLFFCLIFSFSHSQENHEKMYLDYEECILIPQPFTEHVYTPPPSFVENKMANNLMPCSNFIVSYTGFTPEAQTAFQFAVDIWANLLDSPVPIRVDATFTALDPNVLGSAGPDGFLINEPEFMANTAYASALGELIIGEDGNGPSGTSNDINATFTNVADTFYFGTDGNTPANRIDFVTVVLHELGHGLGMLGFARVDDNETPTTGFLRNGGFVHIWDQYIDGFGVFNEVPITDTTNFPDPSPQLLNEYQSETLTCRGSIAITQNGGTRPLTYAPRPWDGGSSYSHWDEDLYPPGNPNALMTPFVGNGQAVHDPGPVTLGFMEDMGWVLCQGSLSNEDFDVVDLSISPNPFSSEIIINLSQSIANDTFEAKLSDINGRVVLTSKLDAYNGKITLQDLDGLNSSLYFLTLTNQSTGQKITKKIVKK